MSHSVTTPGARPASRPRAWIAVATSLVVLAVAATAGLVSSPVGAPLIVFERISSLIGQIPSGAADGAWWMYAFLLGVVAAFNPCGLGLVPAYVGLYLNDEKGRPIAARVRRALAVSAVVAAAFTLLFGVTGGLISAGSTLISSLIVGLFPWAGLGVGVVLIIAGGVALSGKSLGFGAAQRVASRFGRTASVSGTRGYAAFGLAYGLASLGCTLPLFLALLGTATAADGAGNAIVAFVLYGVGMATTLGVLTLIAAIAGIGILARFRGVGRFVPALGAALLLASGAYVVYYWLSAGRLLLT
jgi:cytochrome c-type biogenesis protein